MEKEYVFMKLSAIQAHMLWGVNVDCRGNMKSVDSNFFTGGLHWMHLCFLWLSACKNLSGHRADFQCWKDLSNQPNIFPMSHPYFMCYVIYCYLNHRKNKRVHNESPKSKCFVLYLIIDFNPC